MFVPAQYREPDNGWMVQLLRANPLALLTTVDPSGMEVLATHLPILDQGLDDRAAADGLAGSVVFGHMNRANPHWPALTGGVRGVLVFTGPNAYVSPTVYNTCPAAPTWNFTSVHLHGSVTPLGTADETRSVVRGTVRAFEERFGADWDMNPSSAYFEKLLPAVGAFRFHVDRADGMFKLSQEQGPCIRDRVLESFGNRREGGYRQIADLMRSLNRVDR